MDDLEALLREEGIYERSLMGAVKQIFALQVAREMNVQGLTKTELARRMKTSRAQLERILDPDFNISLETVISISLALGCVPRVELLRKD